MSWEPERGQNFLGCPDAWRHVLQLDPYQQGECRDRREAVPALGKYDDLVPSLFQELASPALPAHRLTPYGFLLTLQPIGGPQRKHQQSEEDMHPHRPRAFLGGMAQVPLLLGFLDAAVLGQTAVIIIIKGLQRLRHPGLGQEHGLVPRPIVLPLPLAHHDGMDRVGLEIAAVVVTPVCLGPMRLLRRQPCDPPTSVSSRSVHAAGPCPWRTVWPDGR